MHTTCVNIVEGNTNFKFYTSLPIWIEISKDYIAHKKNGIKNKNILSGPTTAFSMWGGWT